jgi:hypothetical protein
MNDEDAMHQLMLRNISGLSLRGLIALITDMQYFRIIVSFK